MPRISRTRCSCSAAGVDLLRWSFGGGSLEGPGKITRWFSQRVGWYHGLLRVVTTRFSEVWQVSRRSPFAFYHFILYVGVLSLGLHLAKMASAALLIISLFAGFDQLLASHSPGQFADESRLLHLGHRRLPRHRRGGTFTVVPKSERAYAAPIVPLYLFYAIAHILPMTIGFLNWLTLQAWGRRVYRDHHYESDARSCELKPAHLALFRGKLHDR